MITAPNRPKAMDAAAMIALAALCALLVISLTMKLQAYRKGPIDSALPNDVINLGDGISLRRSEAGRRTMRIATCPTPVTADFVDPSPHGDDALLAAPPSPGDRVSYAYHGWLLSGRFATTELGALHFARRALEVLEMNSSDAKRRETAVKLTMPAGCEASINDAMAALRHGIEGRN